MATCGTRTVKPSASGSTARKIRPGRNQEQCTQRRNAPSEDIVSASERTSAAIYIAHAQDPDHRDQAERRINERSIKSIKNTDLADQGGDGYRNQPIDRGIEGTEPKPFDDRSTLQRALPHYVG